MTQPNPMDFNKAITYISKIKNRFAHEPDVYKQFLGTLQAFQRDSLSLRDVHIQVADLFTSAPDLLEEFNKFIPGSPVGDPRVEHHQTLSASEAEKPRSEGGLAAETESGDTARPAVGKNNGYRSRL